MQKQDRMVTRLFGKKGEVHVVASESEVARMSEKGYTLVAVVYTDKLVAGMDSEVVPRTDPGYTYPNRQETIQRTTCHVVREALFLMKRDGDSALADKEQRLGEMEAKWKRAQDELRAEKERATALAKEREKLEGERETAMKNYGHAVKNYETERDGRRKLEGDIAKVRSAVGAIRMKEILGT